MEVVRHTYQYYYYYLLENNKNCRWNLRKRSSKAKLVGNRGYISDDLMEVSRMATFDVFCCITIQIYCWGIAAIHSKYIPM